MDFQIKMNVEFFVAQTAAKIPLLRLLVYPQIMFLQLVDNLELLRTLFTSVWSFMIFDVYGSVVVNHCSLSLVSSVARRKIAGIRSSVWNNKDKTLIKS